MTSWLNRKTQKKMLEELARVYPKGMTLIPELDLNEQYMIDDFYKNRDYLIEHGFIEKIDQCDYIPTKSGHGLTPFNMTVDKITIKGIDFIANDGGLSAILGVVTVKLHSDTLQALLADRIDQANISNAKKDKLKDALSTIKETGLAKITEMAIENVPWSKIVAAITTVAGLS